MGIGKLFRWATWWNDATPGTKLSLKRGATQVGTDEFGNIYYEAKDVDEKGLKRRFVTYKGYADPSRIPAEWHGWLHHSYDETPDQLAVKRHDWQKPHMPNMTGTLYAYKPPGSLDKGGMRDAIDGEYEAWTPEG